MRQVELVMVELLVGVRGSQGESLYTLIGLLRSVESLDMRGRTSAGCEQKNFLFGAMSPTSAHLARWLCPWSLLYIILSALAQNM